LVPVVTSKYQEWPRVEKPILSGTFGTGKSVMRSRAWPLITTGWSLL
jgi:hypothetical protein